jgi:uncharacterized protein (DUF697 family)
MEPNGGQEYLGAFEPGRAEQLAHGSAVEQKAAIQDLIRKTSATAAMSALQPVPVLDWAILTPLQHRLVQSIAQVRGCPMSDEQVRRVFRAIRRPIFTSQTMLVVSKLVQWIPWVPEIFAASLAYALTFAIGQVSDEYVSRSISVRELEPRLEQISRESFAVTLNMKRDELRALFSDPETRARFDELKKAQGKGTIEDEEAVRRMDAILAEGARRSARSASTALAKRPEGAGARSHS